MDILNLSAPIRVIESDAEHAAALEQMTELMKMDSMFRRAKITHKPFPVTK